MKYNSLVFILSYQRIIASQIGNFVLNLYGMQCMAMHKQIQVCSHFSRPGIDAQGQIECVEKTGHCRIHLLGARSFPLRLLLISPSNIDK